MAYHIFISKDDTLDDLALDLYMGSASTLDFYWESIGRQLNLPIIAALTERADHDDGFSLAGDELASFSEELELFEKYWIKGDPLKGLSKHFLGNLQTIREGVHAAIANGWCLTIC